MRSWLDARAGQLHVAVPPPMLQSAPSATEVLAEDHIDRPGLLSTV